MDQPLSEGPGGFKMYQDVVFGENAFTFSRYSNVFAFAACFLDLFADVTAARLGYKFGEIF